MIFLGTHSNTFLLATCPLVTKHGNEQSSFYRLSSHLNVNLEEISRRAGESHVFFNFFELQFLQKFLIVYPWGTHGFHNAIYITT